MASLFGEVRVLCTEAGSVQVRVIAIDGTKVHVNASELATCDYEQIAREILAEADAVDRDPSSSRAVRVVRSGWPKPSVASSSSVPRRPGRSRRHASKRLRESKRRLDEELASECQANGAYRARALMRKGRRLGSHSPRKPYTPPAT